MSPTGVCTTQDVPAHANSRLVGPLKERQSSSQITTEEFGFVGSSSLVASGLQEASEQMLGFVDTAVKVLEHVSLRRSAGRLFYLSLFTFTPKAYQLKPSQS